MPRHRSTVATGRRAYVAAGIAVTVLIVAAAIVLSLRTDGRPADDAAEVTPTPLAGAGSPATPVTGPSTAPATSRPTSSRAAAVPTAGGPPSRFGTVAAGGALPTGAQCTAWVR